MAVKYSKSVTGIKKPAPSKKELSANSFAAMVAVGTTIAVIITGFALNYLVGQVILYSKVAIAKQTAVNDLTQKIDNAPKLIEAYNQLGSRKDLIFHGLPNTADFPEIVSIIDSMSAASAVKTTAVTPVTTVIAGATASTSSTTATPNAGGAQTTQFSVSVTGQYAKVLDFIKNLEKSARPMRVTAIDFKGTGNSISADIQITSYYQSPVDINDKTEVIK